MNASAGTELLQAARRLKGVGVICTDTDMDITVCLIRR